MGCPALRGQEARSRPGGPLCAPFLGRRTAQQMPQGTFYLPTTSANALHPAAQHMNRTEGIHSFQPQSTMAHPGYGAPGGYGAPAGGGYGAPAGGGYGAPGGYGGDRGGYDSRR